MTASMTNAEINLALARELERSNPEIFEIETEGQWRDGRIDFAVTDDPSKAFPTRLRLGFSPATDRNHFADYVLPEIERRGLWPQFHQALHRAWIDKTNEYYMSKTVLLSGPAVLASAALDTLRSNK